MAKVKPAFRDVLVALTDDEKEQLEANIVTEGRVRESIVLWKDWIVDGHHRHEIAERLGINYQVVIKDFASEADAKDWIILNQLGRRNITESKAKYLRGLLVNRLPAQPGKRTDKAATSDQNDQRLKGEKVADIAEKTGVSVPTVRRDAVFAAAADKLTAPLKAKAIEGELTQKEVVALAKKTKTEQSKIAREARTEGKSVAEVLGVKAGKKEESSGDCPRGGDHKFVDDACVNCSEPNPNYLPLWQQQAAIHKKACDDLNRIKREVASITAEPTGEYLAGAATRITKAVTDAKNPLWQLMPVEEKAGAIITRMDQQSRRKK